MPITPNPRQSFKALLLNYDALLAASDKECCYSLSEREIDILLAFVDYTAWKTRYEPTETEIDQNLIDQWQGNLARKLMSGCCPDEGLLTRFTTDGVFQTSDDGGVTWVDAPEQDPRNQAVQNPPLPGEPSDNKKCAAADNVRDIFKQYRDNLNAMLDASPTLVSVIAGILAFIAVITGISGAAIGISVLLMGLASFLLTLESGGVTALITDTVLHDFRCMAYCRMDQDGRLTYEAWQGLLADIAAGFADFPELFFYQTVNAMGYIGMNNAATTGVTTADDCDCGCGECTTEWHTDNLGGGGNRGTFVGEFDGFLRYSSTDGGSGTQQIFLNSLDPDACCKLVAFVVESGNPEDIAAYYHVACGNAISIGNLEDGWALEGCYNFLGVQTTTGTNIPFTIDFLFAPCD